MSFTLARGFGELPKVIIASNGGAQAEIYLNGATITSWKASDGVERLFVSSKAIFCRDKPIRGGIPICWPQFGMMGVLPQHGFARNATWQVDSHHIGGKGEGPGAGVTVKLSMASLAAAPPILNPSAVPGTISEVECPGGPPALGDARWKRYSAERVRLTVTLTDATLSVSIQHGNETIAELPISTAFHTYLRADIATVSISGLGIDTPYRDSLKGGEEIPPRRAPNATGPIVEGDGTSGPVSGNVDRIYTPLPTIHTAATLALPPRGAASGGGGGDADGDTADGRGRTAMVTGGVEGAPPVTVTGTVPPSATGTGGGGVSVTTRIVGSGLQDLVVWNPWAEKARAIEDLGDADFTKSGWIY